MRHIAILVPDGAILGSIEGPYKLFSEANHVLERRGEPPAFQIELVGLARATAIDAGKFTVHADCTLDQLDRTDLVIIPAPDRDMREALGKSQAFIPWIAAQYKQGAEVASLCLGAFLLAETGLLKGRKCATHWIAANAFRARYPDVDLVDDKIITDEHGIYTSGGAYSHLNLILYLIEKYVGRDVAVYCAKVFAIDIDRGMQSQFIMFSGQKDHDDEPVRQAQEFIERNFSQKITVDQLASMLAMDRRNFERRFKKATANTVVEYMRRVKVEAAKVSLEASRENVTEIMYHVGYTDPKAFRTVFKSLTGLSPIQYRAKYNREAIA